MYRFCAHLASGNHPQKGVGIIISSDKDCTITLATALLAQALAGHTRAMPGMRLSGEVLYNGHSGGEFNVQRTCALVAQQDCHVPVLTVDETLEFASLCQVGRACC
jgi:hypothetical protein